MWGPADWTGFTAQNEKFGCWRLCWRAGAWEEELVKSQPSPTGRSCGTSGTFPAPLLLDAGAVALLHPRGICGCNRSWMITDKDFYRVFTMNFQHGFLNLVKAQICR